MAWSIVFAAPHRGMFAAGMVQVVLMLAAWAGEMAARWPAAGRSFEAALPLSWLHALMLTYGAFPFFVFGFILTAGPRWQKQVETPPAVYRPAMLLLVAGWVIADLGLVWIVLLPAGLLTAAAGWAVATAHFWRLWRRSKDDRTHILAVSLASTAGAAGLLLFAALAAGGPTWLGPLAIDIGLWAFLLPVFATVMHRMLPFFSQSVIPQFRAERPAWTLPAILFGSLAHGALHAAGLVAWTWLADMPAAAAAIRLSWLWRLRASFAARILAVLHVAFAWLGGALALFAVHSLTVALGGSGLGLAPLHALTLGFFCSMLIGMASRVTLGHSGRPIIGEPVMWWCFWTLQAAAVLRMAAEFAGAAFNALAAGAAAGAVLAWSVRYLPHLFKPREDGEPG